MLFKLIGGGEHVEDGVSYKTGDVIESELDLVTQFRGKFEKVYQQDLPDGFSLKKKTVPTEPNIPVKGGEDGDPDTDTAKEEEGGSTSTPPSPAGKIDVTDQFSAAQDLGVSVFRKGTWYEVIDNGEVLNAKKKLRKNQVTKFIREFTESD